jgi:WD40 repeat protein
MIDVQGIHWDHDQDRSDFRSNRNLRYFASSPVKLSTDGKSVKNTQEIYKKFKLKKENLKIPHFQLNNLLCASSKQDIYYYSNDAVKHYCRITDQTQEIFKMRATTLNAEPGLVVGGGLVGDFKCVVSSDMGYTEYGCVISAEENGIINHIDLQNIRSGIKSAIVSCNDEKLRFFNLESNQIIKEFKYPWAINCSSLSPDKRLISIVGDSVDNLILNADSGQVLLNTRNHSDYCFTTLWSPDSKYLVTGSLDTTACIYDVRNFQKPLIKVSSAMSPIQSCRFSSNGSLLLLSEMVDYIHILPMHQSFSQEAQHVYGQTIDFFGDISGISFSPCDEFLYIGVDESTFGAILELELNLLPDDEFMAC